MLNMNLNSVLESVHVGYDTTFEMNEFNEPRIRGELETVKDILLLILFTKPGQYPSLPYIGYDLENKLYSFYDELSENDIMESICAQCEVLRDYFNNGTIGIRKFKYQNQPSLIISISGKEQYPDGYMHDSIDTSSGYMIGISYDELHKMMYDIKKQ